MHRRFALRETLIAAFSLAALTAPDASAQTFIGSFPRARLPNTWQRPSGAVCPAPAIERAFNTVWLKFEQGGKYDYTVARIAGTGIAVNEYGGEFFPASPCTNVHETEGAFNDTGNASGSFVIAPLVPGGSAVIELVVSGNDAADSGTFALTITGAGSGTPWSCEGRNGFLPASFSAVPTAGGSFTTAYQAAVGCEGQPWTASGIPSWITGIPATGSGSQSITFSVAANVGASRSSDVFIAGTSLSVSQDALACTYALSADTAEVDAAASSANVGMVTGASCSWSATSDAEWLSLTGPSGVGPGPIAYAVAANVGPARSGKIEANGQTLLVKQSGGCKVTLPASVTADAAGGNLEVAVDMSDPACTWTASPGADWLSPVTSEGTGDGPAVMRTLPNTGPERSGTVTVNGATTAITQPSGCSVTLPVAEGGASSTGGNGNFAVKAAEGCGWTVKAKNDWLTATVTPTGIDFTAAPWTGASRKGTLVVTSKETSASAEYVVTQESGCVPMLPVGSASSPIAGGAGSFEVNIGAGCKWVATSTSPFVTTATPTGSRVGYEVALNAGPARDAVIEIAASDTMAKVSFSLAQASGCTVKLPTFNVDGEAAGGAARFTVETPAGCKYTAVSSESWITNVTVVDGGVTYATQPNTGASRNGFITVKSEDSASNGPFKVFQASVDKPAPTVPPAPAKDAGAPRQNGADTDLGGGGFSCQQSSSSADAMSSAALLSLALVAMARKRRRSR
jgi:hypothetical protein